MGTTDARYADAPPLREQLRSTRKLSQGLRRLGWPEDRIDELLDEARSVRFDRGRVLYRDGSTATELFWMLEGVAKLSVPGALGKRVLVALAKPGALLGSHLVVGGKRLDEATALTPLHAAALPNARFREITAGLPVPVLQEMTRVTLDYLSRTFARTVKLLTLDLRGKLALGLLDVADGFGVVDADGRLLKIRLTHEELADLTGVSRARVTKALREFADQGLVVRRGRDLVIRARELREVCGA